MDQLIPFMLKSVLLAGAALLLLRLLRGTSASARSVFAHFALVAMIAMPVADMVLPALSIALPLAQLAPGDAPILPVGLPAAPSAAPISSEWPSSTPVVTAPEGLADSLDWAVLAYALPTLCLLFLILLGAGRLFRLRGRAQLLTDPVWLGTFARVLKRMEVERSATPLVSDDIPSPISCGLIRPMILFDRPTLAHDDQAEAIIAHELAHVLHFDWTKLMLARVATALYWFNPLVWLLAREAHQLREEAADDVVLATSIADTDYAELLVRTARARIRRPAMASAGLLAHGMAPDQRSLTRRVRRVLDAGSARGPATLRLGAGMMVGTLGFALPLAALSFEASGPSMAAVASRPTLVRTVMKAVTTTTQRSANIIDETIGLPSIAAEAKEPAAARTIHVEAPVAIGAASAEAPVTHFASIIPSPILPQTATHEAAPFAPQTRIEAQAGPSFSTGMRDTEASLRRYIESLQRGQPNYDEMTPRMAYTERKELPETLSLINKWGALRSITFRGTDKGLDVYEVLFEDGRAEWRIAPLTPDGKVQGRVFYGLKTLFAIPFLRAQMRTSAHYAVLPGTEGTLQSQMEWLRQGMIWGDDKRNISITVGRKDGMVHLRRCKIKKSSGDTEVNLIPCQAAKDCERQFANSWLEPGEFERCMERRMEMLVVDLYDRRGRGADAV